MSRPPEQAAGRSSNSLNLAKNDAPPEGHGDAFRGCVGFRLDNRYAFRSMHPVNAGLFRSLNGGGMFTSVP